MAGVSFDVHNDAPQSASASRVGCFVSTHWSAVLLAGAPDSPDARNALEALCRTYWLPLYSYVRREGYGPHDAQDLIQGFFDRLLRMNSLAAVHPSKGKFRTFLLVSLKHFLSDERDRARAGKRGGGQTVISIDAPEAEERFLQVPSGDLSPDKAFDRRWALTLLQEALGRLRREYTTSNRLNLFEALSGFLSREVGAGDYEALASKMGISPGAVGVAVHRLRQRYRECLRLELAQTVASPNDLEEEMQYLFLALSG